MRGKLYIEGMYLISRVINHNEELFLIRKNISRKSLDASIFYVWSWEFFIDFISVAAKKPFLSDRWQYIFLNLLAFFKGNLWLNFRWIQGYFGYPIFGPVPKLPIVQSPNVYWMKKTALWDQGGNCTANNFHAGGISSTPSDSSGGHWILSKILIRIFSGISQAIFHYKSLWKTCQDMRYHIFEIITILKAKEDRWHKPK